VSKLLSAALIVRDEELALDACLASVAGVVDEIVVVDTGSVDASPEIAVRHGARLLHAPWRDDFSAARNVGLDAAEGDWILYIDADERLEQTSRAEVEGLLADAPEVAFRVLFSPDLRSTPYYEYRLWRHDPRIRFVNRMHEKVTPAIGAVAAADGRPISDCNLHLIHVGYEGDQTRKHQRNLRLLEAQLAVEPYNLFNRHHLARVLDGLGRRDEAEAVLTEAVELARNELRGDPLGVLVFTDLVRYRHERGEDVAELLEEGRRRFPDNKLLWWVEATVRRSEGRYEESLGLLDRLLAVDLASLPAENIAYDARIFREWALDARGACLFRLERYEEAAASYARAEAIVPGSLEYRAKRAAALGRASDSLEAPA
jgi:glycosyltransferase involved in cell wall biosynthesis